MGHTLGLLHTHHPGRLLSLAFNEENATISNGCYQESVSRTRENKWYQGCPSTSGLKKCAINGDFLCDTNADPNQGGRGDGNCNYNYPSSGDFRTDNWGALWTPPTHNVMSYTTNNCRDEFSRSQIGIMWMQMPNLKSFTDYQIPTISGINGIICSGTTRNFTLNNFPSDAQISWEVTPANLVSVSSGNTTTASLSAASTTRGGAELIFTIAGPNNCYIARVKKNIWIGSPEQAFNSKVYVQGFFGENPITLSPEGLYFIQVENVPGATSYNWVLPTGFSFLSSYPTNGSLIKIWTASSGGTYQLRCYPQGPCGSSGTGYTSLTINIPGGGGGDPCPNPPCGLPIPAIVAPNPSTSYFDINLKLSDEEYSYGYEIKLYSANKKDLEFQRNSNQSTVRIETSGIKKGIHILQITTVKQVITDRVFIE